MKTTRIVLASFLLSIILLPFQIGQNQIYAKSNDLNISNLVGQTDSAVNTNSLLDSSMSNPAVSALRPQSGSCHFGITVPFGPSGEDGYDLSILGIDTYLDWGNGAKNSTVADNIQYLRVINVSDAEFDGAMKGLPSRLKAYPGAVWFIGNEPDAEVKYQDNITAETYADRYYLMATLIRSKDPSAKIGFGTIIQFTPVRKEYLKRVITELTLKAGNLTNALGLIDIYSIHAFSLPELPLYDSNGNRLPNSWGAGVPKGYDSSWPPYYVWTGNSDVIDINIFSARVTAFRQWMDNLGPNERAKPLWITEYGSLFPTTLGLSELTTATYMEQTFNYLLGARDPNLGNPTDNNLLVQKWMWYSLNGFVTSFGGSLYDPLTHQLTEVGSHFINYNPSTQLVPVTDPDVYIDQSSPTMLPSSPGHFRITIKAGNTVSTDRLTGVKVDILLGSTVVGTATANLPRCAGRMSVSVDVGNLVTGQSYIFTARVSPAAGNGTDLDLTNNQFTFPPITMPIFHKVMLPIVTR